MGGLFGDPTRLDARRPHTSSEFDSLRCSMVDETKYSVPVSIPEHLASFSAHRGREFIKAFLDIVLGHYIAWANGRIYHRDINLTNTLYRRVAGEVYGVLDDFDLASNDSRSDEDVERLERTGTLPFMALDLLQARSQNETLPHLYRHDLEAFYWMLIWTCNCIYDGQEDLEGERAVFRRWWKGDHAWKLQWEKSGLKMRGKLVQPSQKALWIIANHWVLDSTERVRVEIVRLSNRGSQKLYETDPKASWHAFLNVLSSEELREDLEVVGVEGEFLWSAIQTFVKDAEA
ncbi:unnamed protein product [Peniophora sp. CBMAI 1063]|nr:unnamed protein product [Peniophora sp. CBMAI 1063]